MRICGFDWDARNVAHVARHNVTPEEVEEALVLEPAFRHLVAIFVLRGGETVRIITARDRMPEIPGFRSEEEEAEFWSTHSTADYLDDTEPAELEVDPELRAKVEARAKVKKPVTLRLDAEQIASAKAIAREKGIPYQTLIRMWVVEGIKRETAAR